MLCLCAQPVYELQNGEDVLALLTRYPRGLVQGQIKDAYRGVGDDVKVGFLFSLSLSSS